MKEIASGYTNFTITMNGNLSILRI